MSVWYDVKANQIYVVHSHRWSRKELSLVMFHLHPDYVYIGEFD
jgi:hypothetical protein